jgi:hypothetical protein
MVRFRDVSVSRLFDIYMGVVILMCTIQRIGLHQLTLEENQISLCSCSGIVSFPSKTLTSLSVKASIGHFPFCVIS